jgi:ligand-binding sensor domain-containing protein
MKKILGRIIAGLGLVGLLAMGAGAQWVQTSGPCVAGIGPVTIIESTIVAQVKNGYPYYSNNNGAHWSSADSGLTSGITCFAQIGNNLFAGTGRGIFISGNSGLSWTSLDSGLTDSSITCLVINNGTMLAGTADSGIFISNDSGKGWKPIDSGLTDRYIFCLGVSGGNIITGTDGGLFLSTNNGKSWNHIISPGSSGISSFAVEGSTFYALGAYAIYASSNNGSTWTWIDSGYSFNTLAVCGSTIFAGNEYGIFVSSNNGKSWSSADSGVSVSSLTVCGTSIFVGTSTGLLLSTNNGKTWTTIGIPFSSVTSLAAGGGNIYANAYNGVFYTSNNGSSWTTINGTTVVSSFAGTGGNVFEAYLDYPGILLFSDNGSNWAGVDSSLSNRGVLAILVSGSTIFAGTDSGIFLSTNSGKNWKPIDSGLQWMEWHENENVDAIVLSDSNIFIGTEAQGIFRSSNNGTIWTAANSGLTNTDVLSLSVVGSTIFAGTDNGIFLSNNNGASWTAANSGSQNQILSPRCFAVSGGNIFAGTDYGIFLSTDNGANWSSVNSGLIDTLIMALTVTGGDLFAGTAGAGVWRRPISEMAVLPSTSPRALLPESNFKVLTPSLANSNATIEFSLPSADHISLSVYNLAGHEIASLINQNLASGRHSISWNTRNIAAGCYSVRLRVGANTFVRSVPIVR